jgi:type II restriction/modification system DNA methylase subunit YeeA
MTIKNIEEKVSEVIIPKTPNFEFIYDLLLAYGKPQPSITRLKKGTYNLSDDKDNEIYWKNNLLFRHVQHFDLHETIDDLKRSPYGIKYNPRFIIVTDFEQLLAVDTRTEETLDIPIDEFASHYAFFLPWAGMEKSQLKMENEADVKAAEKMAKLYDEIISIEKNALQDPTFLHSLNIFFSRLLFCFFAEDTEVFKKGQFTNSISSHTQLDGSDLHSYLDELFAALDVEDKSNGYPSHIADFPYVNGGLFNKPTPAPKFNTKARRLIIECGADLNWSEINPDIFGSMIQAVVHPGQRAGLGMHYTSVVNIMKVIEPLFLEELNEEFDHAFGDRKKLEKLLSRIYAIKVFDPACGSGNFLIIAYKELRKIEHKILEQLLEGKLALKLSSGLKLENFYGIEIDDFAHEIATLSLWLAKHQMNIEFKKKFGKDIPLIPLKDTGNVVCENSTRIEWEDVCPVNSGEEVYVIGNPPFGGSRKQDDNQKYDMIFVFNGKLDKYKDLDYISMWFFKGTTFIKKSINAQLAFVTTNSITQGEQVSLLWPAIFSHNVEIGYAYHSFKWSNNAKRNAGVTVSIINIRNISNQKKYLFVTDRRITVGHINAYLQESNANIVISRRSNPISALPKMDKGNMPLDGGNLLLEPAEKKSLLNQAPEANVLLKRFYGSKEYINDIERWCLWITEDLKKLALSIPAVNERIEKTRIVRLDSKDEGAQKKANIPHQFREMKFGNKHAIIVPSVSSERRDYILAGILDNNSVISNLAFAIYDADVFVLGLLISKLHMCWVKTVAGKLKTDIRYSSALAYNNFPIPQLSDKQKQMIERNVLEVLDVRERYSEKNLAELYDPKKMPKELRRAHDDLDIVIEHCYRVKDFDSDEDRITHLFKLYESMTHKQKELI